MGFDVEGFRNASYQPRTAILDKSDLPGISDWVKEGDFSLTVRNLNDSEIQACREVATKGKDLVTALTKIVVDPKKNKWIDDVRNMLGFGGNTHVNTALAIEHVVTASVEPKLDHHIAAKLAEFHPIEFRVISLKIAEITGLGGVCEGKSKASGKTPKSEAV